jgi:hypothetical protein
LAASSKATPLFLASDSNLRAASGKPLAARKEWTRSRRAAGAWAVVGAAEAAFSALTFLELAIFERLTVVRAWSCVCLGRVSICLRARRECRSPGRTKKVGPPKRARPRSGTDATRPGFPSERAAQVSGLDTSTRNCNGGSERVNDVNSLPCISPSLARRAHEPLTAPASSIHRRLSSPLSHRSPPAAAALRHHRDLEHRIPNSMASYSGILGPA